MASVGWKTNDFGSLTQAKLAANPSYGFRETRVEK